MDSSLNGLKQHLRDYVESITEKSKGGLYNCPHCGSGSGARGTGAFSLTRDGLRWKCFSCDNGGDIFDLYGLVNGCTPSESTKALLEMYGRPRTTAAEDFADPPPPTHTPPPSFSAEIERYHAALAGSEGESYLRGRGFTTETMERFKLGYDRSSRSVIIPYNPSGTYYGKRSTIPNAYQPHDNLKGITMPLFNQAGLYTSGVCYVVESPLCAISIMQAGGTAVAISGVGGKGRLSNQLRQKPPTATLALCFDMDDAGRKATADIGEILDKMGIFFADASAAVMGESAKDPNDLLQQKGQESFAQIIKSVTDETARQYFTLKQEEEEARQKRTGAGMVDSFLEAIQTRKYEPIPTGITDIDKALGGGFIRQQLILLGAAPAAGKTAMAQWIFEGMAKRGVTSVYLNLEMSRDQILARSFSRLTAKNGTRIKATDILQGYKWTDEQRKAIMEAAEEYRKDIAPHMIYNPDGVSPVLDTILEYIEKEAAEAEQAGNDAPCVILDYLQIVGSADPREDSAAIIKRAMSSLKDYAMRHNTVVFVIMANNREANKSGDVTMESGRDTSALEYGADLQLGLAFTACLKRNGKPGKRREDLTDDERRLVTLKVTKARFANPNAEVDLLFNGETMTYTQRLKDFEDCYEVDEPTPFDRPRKRV